MAGIWDAVRQVSGFFSLIAFIVAALLLYNRQRLAHESRRLEALPLNQRARALDALLARFHVDTSELSKAQQYEIALTQLKTAERRLHYRFLLTLVATLLLAGLWGLSIVLREKNEIQPPPQPSRLSAEQFDSLTRLIMASRSGGDLQQVLEDDNQSTHAEITAAAGEVRNEVREGGLTSSQQTANLPPEIRVDGREGVVWWSNPNTPPPSGLRGQFRTGAVWLSMVDDLRDKKASRIEIDYLRMFARVNGFDRLISSDEYDGGIVGGGLFQRSPWFGNNAVEPITSLITLVGGRLIVPVSNRPDRVWHVWTNDYPRPLFPEGTTRVWAETRFRIIGAAVLQLGFDYYRGPTDIGCDIDLNGTPDPGYCEAGKSHWIFPTSENGGWQTLTLGK